MGRLYYDNKNFSGGSFENKPIKAVYYGAELLWPDAKIIVSPNPANIPDSGGDIDISVTILRASDKSYSIIGLPDWLTVSNKTETGFTLTAPANHNTLQQGDNSVVLTVKLDNYPSYAILTVNQPRIIPSMQLDIDTSKYNGQFTFFNFPQDAYVDWGDGHSNTYNDANTGTTPSGMASKRLGHTYNTNLGIVTATVFEIIDIPQEFAGHAVGTYGARNGTVAIRMNEGVKYIGNKAFGFNSYLQECKLSTKLISIGDSVFYTCGNFSSDLLFDQLNYIGKSAFLATKVRSFILNSGCTVKNISSDCFSRCAELTSVILSDSVESIDDGSIGSFRDGTFSQCTSLTTFHCGTGLKYIGDYAFFSNRKMHDINIVDVTPNIEHIGFSAFDGTNATADGFSNPVLPAYEVVFNKLKTLSKMALAHNGLFSKITFSNSCDLSVISDMCFTGSFGLKGIALNDKITRIDDSTGGIIDSIYGAFCCPNLQTLTGYWDKITYIGNYAFTRCGNNNANKQILGDISFNTLTYLGDSSFREAAFNSIKINNLTTYPLNIAGNFTGGYAKTVTLGVKGGVMMDINSFLGSMFSANTSIVDFYYYGRTLPRLFVNPSASIPNANFTSSGSTVNANIKIHMPQLTMDLYNPTDFPEWTQFWSKVVAA